MHRWGKYRLTIDGYVFDDKGHQILFLGEDAYETYCRLGAKRFDRKIEKILSSML
jgi:hypothetical protein